MYMAIIRCTGSTPSSKHSTSVRYSVRANFGRANVVTVANLHDAVRAAPRHRIIAIDLGTHGSGFATAKAHDGKPQGGIRQHEAWPDQPCPYPKTRSALLYRGRTPVAWGWSAHKQLLQLTPIEQSSHWYVEDFKLALQDEGKAAEIRDKGLTPEQVMADYLQMFSKYVNQEFRRSGMDMQELENTQWCLTVPAMGSEANKALMRRAAVRAGMIRAHDDDALKIILEPEAAALHARETNAPPLRQGMTVCILDVGGGTADITIQDVKLVGGKAVLAEAVCAEGAMCGSAYVDQAFKSHYRDVVGPSTFDTWATQHPAELQQVMDRWITCKHSFAGVPGRGLGSVITPPGHRVPIPPHLLGSLDRTTRDCLSRQQGYVSAPDVVLDGHTMESLFDGPVTQVVQAATNQLKKLGKQCSVVILVGGFAESAYLQARVKRGLVATGLAAQLVVPPRPYAAVLAGAVIYGCNPSIIQARRSRMAYGIRGCVPFQLGAPQASRFWNHERHRFYSDADFLQFVAKDQLVAENEVVRHTVYPLYKTTRAVIVNIYATDNNQLKWIDDNKPEEHRKLALVEVDLSEPAGDHDREIEVEFRFGQTELSVTAWDVIKQKQVTTQIKFAHD